MLLPRAIAEGVRDGSVSLAFRRWDAPRVKAGSTQLTLAGVIAFDAVDEVSDVADLTEGEAAAAGAESAEALRRRLMADPVRRGPRSARGGEKVYRARLRYVGSDPRVALRDDVPDEVGLAQLAASVASLDAGRRAGPWTRPILEWISDNPGVISTELAAVLGRDVQPMKADIRRLKALGLTESLRVGYRLSPRGRAYLAYLAGHASAGQPSTGQPSAGHASAVKRRRAPASRQRPG